MKDADERLVCERGSQEGRGFGRSQRGNSGLKQVTRELLKSP